jgi:hypothetical protein
MRVIALLARFSLYMVNNYGYDWTGFLTIAFTLLGLIIVDTGLPERDR